MSAMVPSVTMSRIMANIGSGAVLEPARFAQLGAQANDQIESQAGGAHAFVGETAILAVRIHHRHRRRQLFRRLMMIDDHEIETEAIARAATSLALEMPQSTVITKTGAAIFERF